MVTCRVVRAKVAVLEEENARLRGELGEARNGERALRDTFADYLESQNSVNWEKFLLKVLARQDKETP